MADGGARAATGKAADDRLPGRRCCSMAQIHVGSAERRLAQWVVYAVLAAPIVATLLHDLGVGAVAPWIIYAIIAVPMIAMLFHRQIDVDPLLRWILFAIIALTAILPARFQSLAAPKNVLANCAARFLGRPLPPSPPAEKATSELMLYLERAASALGSPPAGPSL
jgi:hypothetical protein